MSIFNDNTLSGLVIIITESFRKSLRAIHSSLARVSFASNNHAIGVNVIATEAFMS